MSNIDPRDLVRLGAAYMQSGAGPVEENEEDASICADDYPEHQTRDTYVGEDGVQWECIRCGAEGREPAEEGA